MEEKQKRREKIARVKSKLSKATEYEIDKVLRALT